MAEREALRVFISYARRDASAFAEELLCGLEVAGFDAFLDRHDIEAAVDWEARLGALIQSADTVVFVITPAAVASPRCKWEVERAEALSKRIIPVVLVDVPEQETPHGLKRLNYIFFNKGTFTPPLGELVRALRIDVEWIREHTRLGELARRWEERGKIDVLLLRGPELAAARDWLHAWKEPAPEPTDRHRAFIAASETAEGTALQGERERLQKQARLQRFAAIATLLLLGVVAIGGWLVIDGRRTLNEASARVLAHFAFQAFEAGDHRRGMRLAMLATERHMFTTPSAEAADALLANAMGSRVELELLGHEGRVSYARFFADGSRVLSEGDDRRVRIWNAENGEQIFEMSHPEGARSAGSELSQDETTVLTFASGGQVQFWNALTGETTGQPLTVDAEWFFAFFGDGADRFMIYDAERSVLRIHDSATGEPVGEELENVYALSENRSVVAGVAPDGLGVKLYNTRTAEQIGSDVVFESQIYSLYLSDDGARLIAQIGDSTNIVVHTIATGVQQPYTTTANGDNVWVSADGLLQYDAAANLANFRDFATGRRFEFTALTRDGLGEVRLLQSDAMLAVADGHLGLWRVGSNDNAWPAPTEESTFANMATSKNETRAVVWNATEAQLIDVGTGRALGSRFRVPGGITQAVLSDDGARALTWGDDGSIRIWSPTNSQNAALTVGHEGVLGATVSDDGRRVISWGNGQIRMSGVERGEEIASVEGGGFYGMGPIFSEAATDRFLDRTNEGFIMRRQTDGGSIFPLQIGYAEAAFSDDGQVVATFVEGVVRRWNAQTGEPIGQPYSHEGSSSYYLSADGRTVLTLSERTMMWWPEGAASVPLQLGENETFDIIRMSRDGSTAFATTISRSDSLNEGTRRRYHRVLWRPGSNSERRDNDSGAVYNATFSRDGSNLLIQRERAVQVWNLTNSQSEPRTIEGTPVSVAVFSPDGTRVMTSSLEGVFKQYLLTGAPNGQTMRQPGSSARYSEDGLRILTVGEGLVRLWNAETGRPMGPGLPLANLRGAALSRVNDRLIAWSDTEVLVWDIEWARPRDVAELRSEVCSDMLASRVFERVVTGSEAGFRWPWQRARTVRASARHVSEADAEFAPLLRGDEGENVCADVRILRR